MLDTVTSICGVPIQLDEWKVDACYAGTQKCMGCPPGVAPLTFGARALEKLGSRKEKVKNWYLDMSMIQKYIEGAAGQPRVYHHTAPISMVYAIREALTLVAEEGLEACQARHQANAEYFWKELGKIGLEPFVAPGHRLCSLTTVKIPEGVDGMKVIVMMRDRFQIEIGGALGSLKGKCWRIGLMGYNNRPEIVKMVCSALAESIQATK
jgi:alanine-glyoxylate transaminase/serine-glyoxylate transaminase/serine-pyruvate transaminase